MTLVRLDPVNRHVGIDVVAFDDVRRVIKGVRIEPGAAVDGAAPQPHGQPARPAASADI